MDLEAAPLSCPEQVRVFLTAEDAVTYSTAMTRAKCPSQAILRTVEVAVGTPVNWDGTIWTIVNPGEHGVTLLGPFEQFQELPNTVFEALVKAGKITGLPLLMNFLADEGEQLLR